MAFVAAVGVALVTSVFIAKAFAPKIKTPTRKLGDLGEQTAEEGNPIPIVFGTYRPISGNIMWSSKPRKYIVKKEAGKGGKGGGKTQYTEEEHVNRSYAIRICAAGEKDLSVQLLRMWRNNKLVYIAPPLGRTDYSKVGKKAFLDKVDYFDGTQTAPSPIIEKFEGVGNVPHHKGLAYIVVDDEDLTDLGGAIPNYTFEVSIGVIPR